MNPYIEKLMQQFSEKPPDLDGAESVIDLIYLIYTEYNPINNQKIRDGFEKLRNHFPNLDLKNFDAVFIIVSNLCAEYERMAFAEGFYLGMMLAQELTEKNNRAIH